MKNPQENYLKKQEIAILVDAVILYNKNNDKLIKTGEYLSSIAKKFLNSKEELV